MKKILLIEDEAHVVSFIKKGLSEEGFEVSVAFDGNTGFKMATENQFDLLIVDIMLPGKNGLEICRELRKTNPQIPVLILSALGTSENIVLGLETGADDYLVKPFKFIELVARIRTLLRRAENTAPVTEQAQDEIYRIADLELNDTTKTVSRDGIKVSLTSTEYRLLLYFMRNRGKVLSRIDILEEVWGLDFDTGTNVVDVYVNYLRKKIEANNNQRLLHTVIGMGYVLREEEQ
ncbi:MAG: response regulator transcription factor [Chitinophagales bacterium]|nr:response regulator transcription factor [Chitinophagales bacterium]